MSVKIIYFVHGTTTDNETGKATGWAGGELSELGIKQAKELKNQIKDKDFFFFHFQEPWIRIGQKRAKLNLVGYNFTL